METGNTGCMRPACDIEFGKAGISLFVLTSVYTLGQNTSMLYSFILKIIMKFKLNLFTVNFYFLS